ncbi:glycosyltransferase family 9 protein [Alteromonadaceae bacterium BrNp21-10]|nr:glycosyltransferase family 9 protein [Alteromonadaceae bacterium BrNp21-10]
MKNLHIGIFRLSAIGDLALCAAMVEPLHHAYPDAKITWITSPSGYALLKGLPHVSFVVIDKIKSLHSLASTYGKLQPLRFDVLLCAQASLSANLIYPMIRAKRKIGFDEIRAKDGHRHVINESIAFERQHLLDGFLALAQKIGRETIEFKGWRLAETIKEPQFIETLRQLSPPGSPLIAINLAASKAERNWPAHLYIHLIKCISAHSDANILLVGGQQQLELAAANKITQQCDNVINMVGKTSLKQLAALLANSSCLVSPDSGPVHIAVAMGTPVIGLYAVARSELSGPYLHRELCIDAYEQAARVLQNQQKSELDWHHRIHDKRAMLFISVDEVFRKLQPFLLTETCPI